MTEFPGLQWWIAAIAIGCAVLSFVAYLVFSFRMLTSEAAKKVEESLKETTASIKTMTLPTAKDVSEILKALGSLAESLVKAGPALWSMIGSAMFLLIAAVTIGVFSGSPGSSAGNEAAERGAGDNGFAENQMELSNENLPVNSTAR